MPVIETETITRRKIVEGSVELYRDQSWGVCCVNYRKARLFISGKTGQKKNFGCAWFDSNELREAAALFTEMADILEKGE